MIFKTCTTTRRSGSSYMGSGCSIHNSNANETIDRLIDYILQFVDDRSDIIDEIGNGNVHLSQTAFVHTSAVLKVILKQLSGVKRDTIVYCDIFGFEKAIDDAFQNGLTPIILDSSHDDKVCTFYSYQPNAIILEAKTLIVQSAKTSLEQSLEFCRRSLVNAMKFGKTMIVRLGTSAPDFRTTFNDSVLCRQGYDVLKPCSGYFPEEVFVKGGVGMFEDGVPERIFREEDMKPHKNFAFCR